jgi:hypothetical protein
MCHTLGPGPIDIDFWTSDREARFRETRQDEMLSVLPEELASHLTQPYRNNDCMLTFLAEKTDSDVIATLAFF